MPASGIDKALERLRARVENGEYYEAQQMYSSLYRRHMSKGDAENARRLAATGATLLAEKKQYGCALELALLVVDNYAVAKAPCEGHSLEEVLELFALFLDYNDASKYKIMQQTVNWCKATGGTGWLPAMRRACAKSYWRDGNYTEASVHFLHCIDTEAADFAAMLVEWSKDAPMDEVGHYITRPILKLLSSGNEAHIETCQRLLEDFLAKHPLTADRVPPFPSPLLNFTRFLLLTLLRDAQPLFQELRDGYKEALARDPEFDKNLDAIAQHFYGVAPSQPAGGLAGLFGSLFQSMTAPPPTSASGPGTRRSSQPPGRASASAGASAARAPATSSSSSSSSAAATAATAAAAAVEDDLD